MVILYDNQYNGRFWPCVECWSSFQVATPNGLESEKLDHRRRATFVCVAASAGTEAEAQSFMEKQWRHVTSKEAVRRLLGPDLLVTNKKDKEVQVHVLTNLNKQVAKFVSTFLKPLRAKLETLSPRHWLDEVKHVDDPVPFGLDLVALGVATTHEGNSRVSSSTREELVTFIRKALSGSTVVNLNSLFPVMVETLKLEHGDRVLSVCALPGGRMLTGCQDNFARVFSDAGAELLKLEHGGRVWSVCDLPGGRMLTGSDDCFARVFSDAGVELLKLEHSDRVLSVCALSGGRMLTGCWDRFARVFSDAGVELLKLEHGSGVRSVCALPGGRMLTGSDDCFARVFSDAGMKLLRLGHGDRVFSVCALPHGRMLTGCQDNFARVFSDAGVELLKLEHGDRVFSVCALPDGRMLTGCQDNFARVFSDAGVELLKLEHGDSVFSVCALPGGRMLTGCGDKFARVFCEQDAVLDEE